MTEHYPTPEQGEDDPVIHAIAIPQDLEAPVGDTALSLYGLNERQELVGGYIEAVELVEPAASMYINGEGKFNGSEPNLRATALLWMHNPAFRGLDAIHGDVVITGAPERNGHDTSIPPALADVLKTEDCTAEIQTLGSEDWQLLPSAFDSWYDAYVVALTGYPGVHSIRLTRREQSGATS